MMARWRLIPTPAFAWVLLVAGLLATLVVGSLAVGGRRPSPAVVILPSPTAPPSAAPATPAPTASPVALRFDQPVHVGAIASGFGSGDFGDGRKYTADFDADDARLTGCHVLQLQGTGGPDGPSWGAYTVYTRCGGWGGLAGDGITWAGEWFSAPGDIWPVDSIWLHGRGDNEGLTVVLRMANRTHIDGWLFPTRAVR